jgi:AmmeMemoRadiSam system protein B
MLRPATVAGRFYPAERAELARQVGLLVGQTSPAEKLRARACLVPHAGYIYSGHVAGAVYARLRLPRRILILGPRHYPHGEALAILSAGEWQTPLGEARIDNAFAAKLKNVFPLLREDEVAHRAEHSLEVQLPFLQVLAGDFQFVPIALGTTRFAALEDLGGAIAEVLAADPEETLIIASSDMNHYESDRITRVKDHKAIEKLLALDPQGLYDTVRNEGISMCGYGPAVVMLTAAKKLGASRAELVRYATSGDVSGDLEEVVGYAGVVFH